MRNQYYLWDFAVAQQVEGGSQALASLVSQPSSSLYITVFSIVAPSLKLGVSLCCMKVGAFTSVPLPAAPSISAFPRERVEREDDLIPITQTGLKVDLVKML